MELRYRIDLSGRDRGEIHVVLDLPLASGTSLELTLPRWTPGSYVLRDYVRHLLDVEAEGGTIAQVDPFRFQVTADDSGSCQIRYTVYARELTVRTSFATSDWVFWNGACVHLWPPAHPDAIAEVTVDLPDDSWSVETGLGPCPVRERTAHYAIDGWDAVVDTPVLCGGTLALDLSQEIGGASVRFVEAGADGVFDWSSIREPLAKIVRESRSVFGGEAPYSGYTFFALFGPGGRGGLEHVSSSVLLSDRTALSAAASREDFLTLVAHEYFHVWNVKRMRPVELWDIDFLSENPTRLLWVSEGFTAYYDDLLSRRAGALTLTAYLERLARSFGDRWSDSSLGTSSLEAWTKLYRAGENTRNSSVNYYVDGSLAALTLDLEIRERTEGSRTLDDAMRHLYASTFEQGRGFTIDDVAESISEAAGADLSELVHILDREPVRDRARAAIERFGIRWRPAKKTARLGVRLRPGTTEIASVVRGDAAWQAGIRAGDEWLALDGHRVGDRTWNTLCELLLTVDRPSEFLFSREGRVLSRSVVPTESAAFDRPPRLEFADDVDARTKKLRDAWLGTP